jgi:DNA polymerase III delta subunit
MSDLSTSRLHIITGSSLILRDDCMAKLLTLWKGPIKRLSEPNDPGRLVLDLETPSLFEEPAAWVVRCGGKWLKKHSETLAPLAGSPVVAGIIVLNVVDLDKSKAKASDPQAAMLKTLKQVQAFHEADEPDIKELASWLSDRIAKHPQGADNPRQIAEALIEHLGNDIDALLNAVHLVSIFADQGKMNTAAVEALIVGEAGRPIWEFTGAILEGKASRALELLHAGDGFSSQQAISALTAEVRKLVACCDTNDDGKVAEWLNSRGKPNLYYARQRARHLGRPLLLRLLTGCLQTQRQLRQSGTDHLLAIETLVLHAQRVIRPAGR